ASASNARNASAKPSAVSLSTAFLTSGRSMMTVVMGPSRSTRTLAEVMESSWRAFRIADRITRLLFSFLSDYSFCRDERGGHGGTLQPATFATRSRSPLTESTQQVLYKTLKARGIVPNDHPHGRLIDATAPRGMAFRTDPDRANPYSASSPFG